MIRKSKWKITANLTPLITGLVFSGFKVFHLGLWVSMRDPPNQQCSRGKSFKTVPAFYRDIWSLPFIAIILPVRPCRGRAHVSEESRGRRNTRATKNLPTVPALASEILHALVSAHSSLRDNGREAKWQGNGMGCTPHHYEPVRWQRELVQLYCRAWLVFDLLVSNRNHLIPQVCNQVRDRCDEFTDTWNSRCINQGR